MTTLKPYPQYKDSGIDWLPKVPDGWQVVRFKSRVRLTTDRADEKSNPVALENIESWTGRLIESDSEFAAEGVRFEAGDVLFGKLRPYLAKSWAADRAGEAVGDFYVMRPGPGVDTKFLNYMTLSPAFISMVDGSTFGSKMPRASWDFIANIRQPFPGIEVQNQIVSFLDRETAQIDELIDKQERLIELLAEKRQAVITYAVTKGLDPAATTTKPSGIPWLGNIPAHWTESQLGTWLVHKIEGGYSPTASGIFPEEESWGVLSLGAVGRGEFLPGNVKAVDPSAEVPTTLEIRDGDLLLTRSNVRERVGYAALVEGSRPLTIFPDLIYRLALSSAVDKQYLACFLSSTQARAQIESSARGSSGTMPKISHDQIRAWRIPLPPLTEQQEIVEFVQSECARIDKVSLTASSAIGVLRERRSALISAAVTGKIDVTNEGVAA